MNRSLIALLVAAGSPVLAQEGRMEHVIVTVPIHKKTAETNLPVTVLSGDALRRAAATSIGETLGNKPGIASASVASMPRISAWACGERTITAYAMPGSWTSSV